MSSVKKKVVIEVANFTAHPSKFLRTGIQEVVYQVTKAVFEIRSSFPELEIVLVPFLPMNHGSNQKPVWFPANPRFILEAIEQELNCSSEDVWGFDLKRQSYHMTDEQILDFISQADFLHFQSLVGVGPYLELLGSKKRPKVSITLYDMVPLILPEYCVDNFPAWFRKVYLPGLNQWVEQFIAISRHSALDLLKFPSELREKKVSYLALPFEFRGSQVQKCLEKEDKFKFLDGQFILILGSVEPRKNHIALIRGFEILQKIHPDPNLHICIGGSMGWKNRDLVECIQKSSFRQQIHLTGYLSDQSADLLLDRCSAVAMLSHYEGYGLSVAQAFARGTPVIVGMGSSLPEACLGSAIFVNPSDPVDVGAALRLVFESDRAAKTKGLEKWNWTNYAKLLVQAVVSS